MRIGKISIRVYSEPRKPRISDDFEGAESNRSEVATLRILSRSRWTFALRGVFSVVFGVVAYSWPALSLETLAFLFGLYALIDGFLLVIHAINNWADRPFLVAIEGLIGISIGAFTYLFSGAAVAVGLVFYIAGRSFLMGTVDVLTALHFERQIKAELWLFAGGMLSILFAVFLIAAPVADIAASVWLVSTYAVAFGFIMVVLGRQLRGVRAIANLPG